MGWLWRRASYSKSSARDEQDATCGLILQCIAVLRPILLVRLVRGLWGWALSSLAWQRKICATMRSPCQDASPYSICYAHRIAHAQAGRGWQTSSCSVVCHLVYCLASCQGAKISITVLGEGGAHVWLESSHRLYLPAQGPTAHLDD